MSYLKISIEQPERADAEEISSRLIAFNREMVNRPDPVPFTVAVREGDGRIRGGIRAIMHFDVLYIDHFWLDRDLQRGGLGARVIAAAEAEGKRRGANVSWLDTFSWQARPFYEKQGYKVFGELPYVAGKHRRYFMWKQLTLDSQA